MSNESLIDKGSFFFPEAISAIAEKVDFVFYFIFWGSMLMFVGVTLVMLYFVVKYRKTEANNKASAQITHNTGLEIVWTVIPTLLVVFLFFLGVKDLMNFSVSPANSQTVKVVGQKWYWQFSYPDTGIISPGKLVVAKGTPFKLIMTSRDVLHSFYIPNLRLKKDVLPNRQSEVWFTANKVGKYQIFCAEYCGDKHSTMLADLVVLEPADYEKWLKEEIIKANASLSPVDLGKKVYKSYCISCHSIDGSRGVGSSWKGLWGSERQFTDGGSAIADYDYIMESINDPEAKVVKGYANNMNSFENQLTQKEKDGIVEYIKTIEK